MKENTTSIPLQIPGKEVKSYYKKSHFALNSLTLCYNSLGKYQIQGRRKEQLYTKDKTALNVILSDCTRPRTFSQYVYGGSIFHS